MRQERIIKQVDKMVKSGRITEEEAAQLRATEGTPALEHPEGLRERLRKHRPRSH
jgi:hypothetical protein